MKVNEAYSLFELSENATPEEAKKKYRELTKKYHPDVNKEEGAEDRFKKINEAYQVISTGKSSDPEPPQNPYQNPFHQNPFGGFNINFNDFFAQQNAGVRQAQIENINLDTTISFKESILGCNKSINFRRKIKCSGCNGNGSFNLDNGCKECNGRGNVIRRLNGMVTSQTCPKCMGKIKREECKSCVGEGCVESESSISVKIPGGVDNQNILRLNGIGNYVNGHMHDIYSSVYLKLFVEKDDFLKLDGQNVVCEFEISLLEALKGCDKEIKTIHGDKTVSINKLSKNNDKVIVPKHGVSGVGDQVVTLNVKYPENIDKIIEALES